MGEGQPINYHQELVDRNSLYLDTGLQFIGNSEDHLTGYVNVDPLLPDTRFVAQMVQDMVEPFVDDDVEAVLTAAVGAIPLGTLAAKQLMDRTGINVRSVWADKKEPKGQEIVRHGFRQALAGKRVLLLDGIVNSMFTASELQREAVLADGEMVGMTSVAANSNVSSESLGIAKFHKLVEFHYDIWTPEACAEYGPCSQNVTIVDDLGHGADYKDKNPNYTGGFVSLLAS